MLESNLMSSRITSALSRYSSSAGRILSVMDAVTTRDSGPYEWILSRKAGSFSSDASGPLRPRAMWLSRRYPNAVSASFCTYRWATPDRRELMATTAGSDCMGSPADTHAVASTIIPITSRAL